MERLWYIHNRETYGNTVLDFFYDANGTPFSMLQNRGAMYYYITNLQGDVIRLVNSSGQTAAYYEYDPYGRATEASGSHATINPLRYRGYVYDTETGLYYCQSRHYDPAIGRFISADAYASTGSGIIGFNMYAYCYNNPINYLDCSGCLPKWLDAIVDTAHSIWNAITDFFSPETDSVSGTYDDGSTQGNATVTVGYSDISIGFTGQENVIDKTQRTYQKDGFVGLLAEASVVNANGKIGSTQNDNMGLYLNGTADALALSGYAGFQYKNGLGIGAGAYATVLTGTVTADFDIWGWSIVIGVTGDLGSIGVEGKLGFIDGVGSCKLRAGAGLGGGFIVEVGLPESYY